MFELILQGHKIFFIHLAELISTLPAIFNELSLMVCPYMEDLPFSNGVHS